MALQLKAKEPVPKGIKRIVSRELSHASDGLINANDNNLGRVVHDTRVHFKKIRAVLRLVRDDMGDTAYRLENKCFRDAARPLTRIRDAEVQLETLDNLTRHFPGAIPQPVLADIRRKLLIHCGKVRQQVLDEQRAFASILEVVREASSRPSLWPIEHKGWQALSSGVKRIYKSGRQAFARAEEQPTPAHFHEWRKQAKYLWYQMEALEDIKPRALKKFTKHCRQLTQLLGEDHDLSVLQKTLGSHPEAFGREEGEPVIKLIRRRRGELEIQSFELGRTIYGDKPKAFVGRLEKYWNAWSAY